MLQRLVGLVLCVVFMFSASGCAVIARQNEERSDLRTRVSEMERQLEQKDEEIASLKRSLSKGTQDRIIDMRAGRASGMELPSVTNIQTALKNAGYDPGKIDGKMGSMTRAAVKKFQKDNGLYVDGKVGKKTWAALESYLNAPASAK